MEKNYKSPRELMRQLLQKVCGQDCEKVSSVNQEREWGADAVMRILYIESLRDVNASLPIENRNSDSP